ncbi:MAG: hypothetical protein JSS09_07145 [Verrucomicrobia bacterium]|nr:hypothetical protein [Verrucomicrobiota bacterium]
MEKQIFAKELLSKYEIPSAPSLFSIKKAQEKKLLFSNEPLLLFSENNFLIN